MRTLRQRFNATLSLLALKGNRAWERSVLADLYGSALDEGYQMAVHDFFNATTRDGEPDQNWYTREPSIRRRRGALKRYYGVR